MLMVQFAKEIVVNKDAAQPTTAGLRGDDGATLELRDTGVMLATDEAAENRRDYLSCVRGYAIVLVICSHTVEIYGNAPETLLRVARMGHFGVQLFFMASMITLLTSWHAEASRYGNVSIGSFAIRRACRIAPAYYLAAATYLWLSPPPEFTWHALGSYLTFANAWDPTTADRASWKVVPGGWSISVEMSFYLLFPAYASYVTDLRKALTTFGLALLVGVAADQMAAPHLAAAYGANGAATFLYFWPPNQASVFALGGVAYFAFERGAKQDGSPKWLWAAPYASMAALGLLAFAPLSACLGLRPGIPVAQASALVMLPAVAAMAAGRSPLVNAPMKVVGQLSFGAYLIHFAVLRWLTEIPAISHANDTGGRAAAAYAIACQAVVIATLGLSYLSWRIIEKPGITLGRKSTRQVRAGNAKRGAQHA